jgi:hypothetical protein
MPSAWNAPLPHGLTLDDCATIAECGAELPGAWSVHFDRFDGRELFARLIAPGNDDHASAFLIERQSTAIILTDRLSNHIKDHCSMHGSAEEAAVAVRLIIQALSGALRCDARALN